MTQRIVLADVFAEQRYAGNPLAVAIGDEALPSDTMQKLAAEINYSETTFVSPLPLAGGGFRVRIFTPAREIAFAGHPILGTASVLRHHLALPLTASLRLNLMVGRVTVTFEQAPSGLEVAWFEAPRVLLGAICAREAMAAALGLSPHDIDARSPVQQASAGTSAMIVPLVSLDALRRCRLDLSAYAPLTAQGFPPLVYLFSRETHDPHNDLCARFFFEAHGVREDPATGNAAAFLGAYLLQHRVLSDGDVSLRIEQGHQVRRPSLVLLRARRDGGSFEIHVGGAVIQTVRGELL
jgi:trans-2,3-dihydro-3-hydroxyanthranilate isomerase